jgi:hypothetical protein
MRFHSGNYSSYGVVGSYITWPCNWMLIFRRKMLSPFQIRGKKSFGLYRQTERNFATQIGGANKETPWSESASELYRPCDRRLSAKGLPTFFCG